MSETKDSVPATKVEYKGHIFDGPVTYQAWSIAARLEPDPSKLEERRGLAIAAQIGLNHDLKPADPNKTMQRKLIAIQRILYGDDVV